MRKYLKRIIVIGVFLCHAVPAWAVAGVLATSSDIARLKEDLRWGRVQIGKTRLNEVRLIYGDPSSIANSVKMVGFVYADLKVEFEKNKYLKEWGYDSFQKTENTDDIEDLRNDLEDGQIVGKYVSLDQIRKKYGEPTEFTESDEDGALSTYYYGNIKLVFENFVLLRKWQGKVEAPKMESLAPEATPSKSKSDSEPAKAE